MNNEIHHKEIVIEFDLWMPMHRQVEKEIDDIICQLKAKTLLAHAGNVKAILK